jgi:hypothetical protein
MGKLGQLLVARGWITVQQLTRALQNQSVVGGRLGTCLIEIDAISEDLLLKGLSEQLGVPAASLDDLRGVPEEVLALLPEKLARRCRAVPFRVEGSRLDLAMMDARNLSCQDEIAFATGKRVKIHVAHELRVFEGLERYYREESPSRFSLLVDRLNRARYFWEKQGGAGERGGESAATLASPLEDLFGARPPRIAPPPVLPQLSQTTAPRPLPQPPVRPPVVVPAAPAPVAARPAEPVAPAPRPALRPVSIPLTEEERAALVPLGSAAASVSESPAAPLARTPAPAPIPAARPAATGAGAPQPLPPLLTLDEAEEALAATHDQEQMARIVLGFLTSSYRRAALFQVARDKATAWMAQGEVDLDRFGKFAVSLEKPSVFLNLRHGQAFYVGPLPPMPAHRELAQAWGGELPRDCVVLPVRMKDRLVAVIYADGADKGLGGIDLTQLQSLAASTAAALQRGILHKKKGEAGA